MILKRVGSFLAVIVGWLLAGARFVADLIGYSTLPDDAKVASKLVDRSLDFLLATPAWVVWVCALLPTLLLINVSWPREATSSGGRISKREKERLLWLDLNDVSNSISTEIIRNGHGNPRLMSEIASVRFKLEKIGYNLPKIDPNTGDLYLVLMRQVFDGLIPLLRDSHFKEAKEGVYPPCIRR